MTDEFTDLGKQTWQLIFPDFTSPEKFDWYIIFLLENGYTCPCTKKNEIWKISGGFLFFELGLFEKNLRGSAFSPDGQIFGNSLFVIQNPQLDWIRVVDYFPVMVDSYDPVLHNSWKPGVSELPIDLKKTESPIEKMFLNAAKSFGVKLTPQVHIGKYRVDFQLDGTQILIELDGHGYHASREERESDASRDRELFQKGYTVIRFTSDEIFRNVNKCIDQLITIIDYKEGKS